jgi:hypothetical protein
MKITAFIHAVALTVCLWSCSQQPQQLSHGVQDSTAVRDSGATQVAKPVRDPGRPADLPAQDTGIAPSALFLASLNGMSLESAMEIDDFRNRLEHDWGDVHSILMSAESSFAPEGSPYLVAKGEIKQGGFTWAAILIVDLYQDAVFAAQYDGENKVFNQFEEEKEGLSQPAPLTAWTAKYR